MVHIDVYHDTLSQVSIHTPASVHTIPHMYEFVPWHSIKWWHITFVWCDAYICYKWYMWWYMYVYHDTSSQVSINTSTPVHTVPHAYIFVPWYIIIWWCVTNIFLCDAYVCYTRYTMVHLMVHISFMWCICMLHMSYVMMYMCTHVISFMTHVISFMWCYTCHFFYVMLHMSLLLCDTSVCYTCHMSSCTCVPPHISTCVNTPSNSYAHNATRIYLYPGISSQYTHAPTHPRTHAPTQPPTQPLTHPTYPTTHPTTLPSVVLLHSAANPEIRRATPHCNTLQHTATHCKTVQRSAAQCTYCNTLQHSATLCNTLQHTHSRCRTTSSS